jgi:hypothetical protein
MATSTYTEMAIHICVLTWGSAIEGFDSEMLFYPFEKQFHLSSKLVQLGHGQSRKFEIVCEKDETLSRFLVEIDDPPQFSRIVFRGFLN